MKKTIRIICLVVGCIIVLGTIGMIASEISPNANAVCAQIDALNRELNRHRVRFESGAITAKRFADVERRIGERISSMNTRQTTSITQSGEVIEKCPKRLP